MSRIETISPRASFARKEDELRNVITSGADQSKTKIVGAILLLWLIGGGLVISSYFTLTDQRSKVMLLVWLAFWLYFTYVMGKAFNWHRRGREIIKVRNGKIYYKKDVNGRGWVNDYPLESIKTLQPTSDKSDSWIARFGGDYWSTDCDSLRFHSMGKEIAFGFRLTEKERERITKLLKQELKGLKIED